VTTFYTYLEPTPDRRQRHSPPGRDCRLWPQLFSGTLSATATPLTVPTASLLGGNGSALTSVTLDISLTLTSGTLAVASPYNASTVLLKSGNLAGLTSLTQAQTNLGLGSMATQNSTAVAISGGAITGGTIDNAAIGSTTPSTIKGTTLALTGSLSASYVLAGPAGAAGAPTWRQLSLADLTGVPNGNHISGNGSTLSAVTAGTGLSLTSGTLSVPYGTAAGTAAQGNDSRITGAAQVANNLSDMASPVVARVNVDQGLVTLTYATTITPNAASSNMFTVSGLPSYYSEAGI
jgi:hypothetical protein